MTHAIGCLQKTFEIPLPRVEIKVGVIRTAAVQPGVFGDRRKSFPRPAGSDICGLEGRKNSYFFSFCKVEMEAIKLPKMWSQLEMTQKSATF